MKRVQTWPGSIPRASDLLYTNRHQMTALAAACMDMFGTSTVATGFACTATSPASMSVSIAPGNLYGLLPLDATAYSSLPADTAHSIVKQAVALDAQSIVCSAPATSGQSVAYLIQAVLSEVDTDALVLPYYNSTTPSQPYSGANNSGAANYTTRACVATLTAKAGTAATTGSQVAPAPDSGAIGLWVVTVAYGATTITAANIAAYPAAPLLTASLLAMIQARPTLAQSQLMFSPVIGQVRNLNASCGASATTVAYTADSVIVGTALGGQTYDLANVSATLNLATTGIGGMDTGALTGGAWGAVYAAYNPTTGAKGVFCTLEGSTAAATIYAGSALPVGYTATALIGFVRAGTTAGQLVAFSQKDRVFYWGGISPLNGGVSSTSSVTPVGVAIPYAARKISGSVSITNSAAGNGVFTFVGDANGCGSKLASVSNGSGAAGNLVPYDGLLLSAPKTFLYYVTVSGTLTVTYQVYVTAFEF